MLFSFFDAVDWGAARLNDLGNFLRSIPSFFAPKPTPFAAPWVPPFTGGQCVDGQYRVYVNIQPVGQFPSQTFVTEVGKVLGLVRGLADPNDGLMVGFLKSDGTTVYKRIIRDPATPAQIDRVERLNGLDNCGNLSNPTPAPSINDDGLFTPNNPVIGDENGTLNPAAIILSPAAPIIAIGGGLALAAAAAAAAKAATDALEAIKKVAEALDSLKKLWEKLQEFLEEWDKDRPKNRDIVRQTYGNIDGDGAIDFYPLNNKNFVAIQVDIIVTEVPLGFGKYFGSMSPSRYRYKELGYISFYSINKGIIETHSIQFKRSSLIIPKTAVGFIYHFGLDNKIKGFAFGTFSVRKT